MLLARCWVDVRRPQSKRAGSQAGKRGSAPRGRLWGRPAWRGPKEAQHTAQHRSAWLRKSSWSWGGLPGWAGGCCRLKTMGRAAASVTLNRMRTPPSSKQLRASRMSWWCASTSASRWSRTTTLKRTAPSPAVASGSRNQPTASWRTCFCPAAVLLDKVQEALAVGGRRRKAVQRGGIFRANPDAPPAAPRRAELHRPNQAVIRAGNGGSASSAGRKRALLGPATLAESLPVRKPEPERVCGLTYVTRSFLFRGMIIRWQRRGARLGRRVA